MLVKALGLHWRGGRLLAAEVRDDAGALTGARPLGGTVEFGEPARETVIREFREELGVEASAAGPLFFMENLYVHEGAPGHEIVVAFEVTFPAGAFADATALRVDEGGGRFGAARWFDLDGLDLPGGPRLFPDGLKRRLRPAG